jgi:hypothetical protein
MVQIRIENAYSDGHESVRRATVAEPASMADDDLDAWWQDVVFGETGDGHGVGKKGSCYTVTVLRAKTPGLTGQSHEWVG